MNAIPSSSDAAFALRFLEAVQDKLPQGRTGGRGVDPATLVLAIEQVSQDLGGAASPEALSRARQGALLWGRNAGAGTEPRRWHLAQLTIDGHLAALHTDEKELLRRLESGLSAALRGATEGRPTDLPSKTGDGTGARPNNLGDVSRRRKAAWKEVPEVRQQRLSNLEVPLDDAGRFVVSLSVEAKGTLHVRFAERDPHHAGDRLAVPHPTLAAGLTVEVQHDGGKPTSVSLREDQRARRKRSPEGQVVERVNFTSLRGAERFGEAGDTTAIDVTLRFGGRALGTYRFDPSTGTFEIKAPAQLLSADTIRDLHTRGGVALADFVKNGATIAADRLAVSKAELHSHFLGALRAEDILKVARAAEVELPVGKVDAQGALLPGEIDEITAGRISLRSAELMSPAAYEKATGRPPPDETVVMVGNERCVAVHLDSTGKPQPAYASAATLTAQGHTPPPPGAFAPVRADGPPVVAVRPGDGDTLVPILRYRTSHRTRRTLMMAFSDFQKEGGKIPSHASLRKVPGAEEAVVEVTLASGGKPRPAFLSLADFASEAGKAAPPASAGTFVGYDGPMVPIIRDNKGKPVPRFHDAASFRALTGADVDPALLQTVDGFAAPVVPVRLDGKRFVADVVYETSVVVSPDDLGERGMRLLHDRLAIDSKATFSFPEMDVLYDLRQAFVDTPRVAAAALRAIAADYQGRGIRYAELSIHSKILDPTSAYGQAILAAAVEIERDTGVRLRFLVNVPRDGSPMISRLNQQTLLLAQGLRELPELRRYVVGVDLLGHELTLTGEHHDLLAAFKGLRQDLAALGADFVIRIHAGENVATRDPWLKEALDKRGVQGPTTDNVRTALDYATRIGHGIHGVDDATLEKIAARRAAGDPIIVELNLNSNVALRNLDSPRDAGKTIRALLDAGAVLTLGTDGHGLYRTSHRSEEAALRTALVDAGLSAEEAMQLATRIAESDLAYIAGRGKRLT